MHTFDRDQFCKENNSWEDFQHFVITLDWKIALARLNARRLECKRKNSAKQYFSIFLCSKVYNITFLCQL